MFVPKEKKVTEEEEEDPVDAKIAIGEKCLHYCCNTTFINEDTRNQVCTYHKGEPVFHEGSKYWSCCPKKKFAEFEEIFKVEGCTKGKHKFVKNVVFL